MRPSARKTDVLSGAAALLAAAFALPLSAQQPASAATRSEVVAVDFEGRNALDAETIEDALATHSTSCRSALVAPLCLLRVDFARTERYLDSAQVALDAERIATAYEVNGYAGTTVGYRIEHGRRGARVVFIIDEAPPFIVESIELRGLPPGVDPPAELPLREGEPYALPELDASIERIEFLLARHGYPYASVEVGGTVDETARRARLTLTATPGARAHFGDVRIAVDAPLRARTARERLALEPGQPYDPLALERTERRLYALEATGRAIVRVEGLRDSATVVPVVVEMTPRALRGIETEATVSTTDCVEAAAFWTHRHLGARPRVVRVGGALSNLLADQLNGFPCTDAGVDEYGRMDYRALASLDEPIAGTAHTWARVQLFAERHSAPDVFVEQGFGAVAALSRHSDDDLGYALEYAPRRFELESAELYLCGNYGACELDAAETLAGPAWLSPVTASVVWMSDGELQGVTRDKLSLWRLEPLPAFRAEVRGAIEAAGAWSLSDVAYQRALVQASATRRFGGTIELSARLRGGAVFGDDVLPPRVRLFSGGPMSVRGVQQNLLGPATLVADPGDLDAIGCAPTAGGCPEGHEVDPALVRLRPLGGRTVIESGVEARWSFLAHAQAAAFVDFGHVGAESGVGGGDDWIVSPGVGLRLIANIGAIRIDLGYDPRGARTLPLRSSAMSDGEIIHLGDVRYDPFGHDDPSFLRETLRRLQLQFAIGQAF